MMVDNYDAALLDKAKQLKAMCLKEIPTVDNWRKTGMSKHVAKYVNNRDLPPMPCSIIKEEYPEWFL